MSERELFVRWTRVYSEDEWHNRKEKTVFSSRRKIYDSSSFCSIFAYLRRCLCLCPIRSVFLYLVGAVPKNSRASLRRRRHQRLFQNRRVFFVRRIEDAAARKNVFFRGCYFADSAAFVVGGCRVGARNGEKKTNMMMRMMIFSNSNSNSKHKNSDSRQSTSTSKPPKRRHFCDQSSSTFCVFVVVFATFKVRL